MLPKPAPPPIVDPGLIVGGVIISGDVRKAYVYGKADSHGTWVSEGETLAGPHEGPDPFDHEPTSGHGCTLGIERRQTARDFVGIDELADAEFPRDHSGSGRRLPRTIGSADNDDIFQLLRSSMAENACRSTIGWAGRPVNNRE